jgi:hypothetical protein
MQIKIQLGFYPTRLNHASCGRRSLSFLLGNDSQSYKSGIMSRGINNKTWMHMEKY